MTAASLTWKCPGCGATVILSEGSVGAGGAEDYRRRDQLAQALCGCWVTRLPDKGLARLLRAVVIGDEGYYDDLETHTPGVDER